MFEERTGNASRDDDDIGAGESLLEAVILGEETGDFLHRQSTQILGVYSCLVTYGNGGDVREISGNTGGVDHIVESQLVDQRAGLEEEREGLLVGTMVS
jgi:hypothetical protein